MVKSLIKKLIPGFLLSWYYLFLAVLGAVLYGFPSKKLIVIGVTGTNGKSTVVNLAAKIFEEAGHKTASLSSIKFKIGEKEWQNTLKMTMPGRFKLQKFLRDAVDAGCKYAVIEVTSEGIKQWRHFGIDFDVAVFTNLTKEHIESHGSFEKYREAKSALFRALTRNRHKIEYETDTKQKKVSIINLDDENAEYFLQFPAEQKYGYGIDGSRGEQKAENSKLDYSLPAARYSLLSSGIKFVVNNTEFNLKLHGKFNIYNALAAICIGLSKGVDMGIIKKALERIEGVPGRFEIVVKKPFTVIVDYAHTPDGLINVYKTIGNSKLQNPNSKLICVLGAAGGGRDKWKRPEFGKIAEKYCDEIILTNEDPYDENPDSILSEIESGFSQIRNSKHETRSPLKILDRREAIRKALSSAEDGDTVVITGKGCEPWMMVAGGKRISWDDRKVVREELKKTEKLVKLAS